MSDHPTPPEVIAMPLTPEDVQNKRFTVVRFKSGYDEEEVDGFLDEVEAELRRVLDENSSLRQSVATAPQAPPAAPPPPPPPVAVEDPNETALRTLLLAQRTADDAIAQAQSEAESMLTDARGKAAVLEAEAQAAHLSRVAILEHQRAELEAEITSLRSYERDFRTRLRAYLQTQLGELESRPTVAPAEPGAVAAATLGTGAAPAVSAPVPATSAPHVTPPPVSAPPLAGSPLAAAAAAASEAVADPPLAVPGLAPPAEPAGANAPVAGRPPAAGGPFSAAPTPGTAPFASRPAAPVQPPVVAPPAAGPRAAGIDTDVDAGSDVPSGPPTQADEETDDDGE